MANTMRWRYGDTNPVLLPVLTDTQIEIGDLVYLDTDNAKPASSLADQSTPELNQSALKDSFVGVAMQASPAGVAGAIRIATSGVFELDCASATFELGDLIGATENASGDQLLDQSVQTVAAIDGALGRCAKRVPTASARVLVDLVSTVMRGGAHAA